MTVITTRSAARHPTSSIVLTGPRAREASRSRKTRPSFQKCRILPCPFRPVRTVYEPQRPTCANPGQGCRFWGGARGALPGIPPGRNYHPDPQLPPWAATTAPNQNYRLEPQLPAPAATNASDNNYRPGSNAILGPKVPPRAATIASGTCVDKFFFRGCARNRFL